MTRSPKSDNSSQAIMQTLQWLRKQNFRPVPLHPQSKAAVNRDYVDPRYEPPGDELWRNGNFGVGVATGPQHGGPVDIDLDCEEAVAMAPFFLPATKAVFGRASKRRSHYLYRVTSDLFDKQAFLDPTTKLDATIVEMRGDNGHQTVMPGSLHQDTAEPIEWDEVPFPDVTTVSTDDLIKAVKKLAIAVLLVRHVWADGYHNEPCMHLSGLFYYLGWTVEDAEQVISALMSYSGDSDKSRLPTVRATYRRGEAGKKISGAGKLRRQLGDDRVVDRLLEWAGSPTVNMLQEYNERFAIVPIEGKIRIAETTGERGEHPTFYAKDDFMAMMAADFSDQVDDKGKRIPKARAWFVNPRRRQYKGVDFLPGIEESDKFNLWTGWTIGPDPAGSCAAWLELLHDVICGGDRKLSTWMLHWFANILREPMNKSQTAPVIIGPEGAGKSLMLRYFGEILGQGYITVTNEEHVYGKFNKHLSSCLLMHSEEALYGGEKRHAGIIRSLITDEFRIHEQKGIDGKRVRNFLRLVLTSNEAHAAPAKPGDRRYTVDDMGDRKASKRLIASVLKELNDGGPAALHHHLVTMNYDPELARQNVMNDALIGMKQVNMSPVDAWWNEALTRGQALPDCLSWCTQPEKDDWPEVVSSVALGASFMVYCQAHGLRGAFNGNMLAQQLDRYVGRKLWRSQRRFDDPMLDNVPIQARNLGERQYAVTNLPDLATCRDAFEKYLGQEIDWPDEDDEPKERKESDKF